jgi:diphosphomevalonate decarboxylase
MRARAIARANIAIAKYWGKSDDVLNLPAVPSVSVTLDPLLTETTVHFLEGISEDTFVLDGEAAKVEENVRVTALLDGVRGRAGLSLKARVESRNHFPTAAGLASSASGFAALAGAASVAAGLDLDSSDLSAMARQASASAARSVFGGYAELPAGVPGDAGLAARPIAPPDHWDLRVVVAVTQRGRKPIGSRTAMRICKDTSAYYEAWIERSGELAARIRDAVVERDFPSLAAAGTQSFYAMHAVAMTSLPPVLYWQPPTVAALHTLRELADDGVPVFPTMDAGPHVKAICPAEAEPRVVEALEGTPGVLRTLRARPGAGLQVETLP